MTLHRYYNVHKEYLHAVELSRAVGARSHRCPPSGAHAKWATTKMRWATTSGWATKDGQRSEQVQNDRWHAFAPFDYTAAHYKHPVSPRMLLWSCQKPTCIPSRQAIAAHNTFQLFNSAKRQADLSQAASAAQSWTSQLSLGPGGWRACQICQVLPAADPSLHM